MKIKNKVVSIVTAAIIFTTLSPIIGTAAHDFSDINAHWSQKYIKSMANAKLLDQFNEDLIRPDKPITRGESAELIDDFLRVCFEKPDNPLSENSFTDLKSDSENIRKINSLASIEYKSYLTSPLDENGEPVYSQIINGYPDGEFKPESNITRAEFAKILLCALDAVGSIKMETPEHFIGDSSWYDESGNLVSHWGHKYLELLYKLGIMNGYSSHDIDDERVSSKKYIEMKPDNNITRAEAIKMVDMARALGGEFYGLFKNKTTRPYSEAKLYYMNVNLSDDKKVDALVDELIKTVEVNQNGSDSEDIPKMDMLRAGLDRSPTEINSGVNIFLYFLALRNPKLWDAVFPQQGDIINSSNFYTIGFNVK